MSHHPRYRQRRSEEGEKGRYLAGFGRGKHSIRMKNHQWHGLGHPRSSRRVFGGYQSNPAAFSEALDARQRLEEKERREGSFMESAANLLGNLGGGFFPPRNNNSDEEQMEVEQNDRYRTLGDDLVQTKPRPSTIRGYHRNDFLTAMKRHKKEPRLSGRTPRPLTCMGECVEWLTLLLDEQRDRRRNASVQKVLKKMMDLTDESQDEINDMLPGELENLHKMLRKSLFNYSGGKSNLAIDILERAVTLLKRSSAPPTEQNIRMTVKVLRENQEPRYLTLMSLIVMWITDTWVLQSFREGAYTEMIEYLFQEGCFELLIDTFQIFHDHDQLITADIAHTLRELLDVASLAVSNETVLDLASFRYDKFVGTYGTLPPDLTQQYTHQQEDMDVSDDATASLYDNASDDTMTTHVPDLEEPAQSLNIFDQIARESFVASQAQSEAEHEGGNPAMSETTTSPPHRTSTERNVYGTPSSEPLITPRPSSHSLHHQLVEQEMAEEAVRLNDEESIPAILPLATSCSMGSRASVESEGNFSLGSASTPVNAV